tara:strand:- start:15277 stop:15696 length:420 start_codon:yes stop_codon:yes gene_type:complete
MGNPVWRLFIAEQAEEWLEWLKNIHLNSYQEMIQRFIYFNPHYLPGSRPNMETTDISGLFTRLMLNREFILKLSDTGIVVWMNSNIHDFLDELKPYSIVSKEFKVFHDLISRNDFWFNRQFQFLKEELLDFLRENGRQL